MESDSKPSWIFFDFSSYPKYDKFILDHTFNFLPHIWGIILFISTIL